MRKLSTTLGDGNCCRVGIGNKLFHEFLSNAMVPRTYPFTTKFTMRPGTTITFTTFLPSSWPLIVSSVSAAV